ncbi:MAG TPA: peptidoglycan DD-metalloendopeptidase family protein [Rhodanobacteraceae bacterium]|nr:peptidoglycan DD-metalloendopeptidase family protein [Rhodanobacteraceae bacterium]
MKYKFLPKLQFVLCCAAPLFLAACASTGPAPVIDRSLDAGSHAPATSGRSTTRAASTDAYRVRRGDTLYSIAFNHGLDYRQLAGWNDIEPPYTIYVGQQLRLSTRGGTGRRVRPAQASVASPPPVRARPVPTPMPTPFQPAPSAPSRVAEAKSQAPPPPPSSPSVVSPVIAAPVAASPAPATPLAARSSGGLAWSWPAQGRLISNYVGGDPTRQGIDIAGNLGDPVRAAAAGTVVYSGNGLIGYGELIIIKHSPAFLSAYGHNSKRLVQEGQHVAAGQIIADMGASGANRNALHFEIRNNGKPVDPLDYLPRR